MNGKSILIGIILLVVGLGAGYYFATSYKVVPQGTSIPTPTQEVTLQPTSVQAIDEKAAIIAAVRMGLIAGHGPDAGAMTITVSKIQDTFASGGAIDPGSVGGGMWFAAKVNGAWKLAWDGNGTISCASVNPYNFPALMIPECWDDATQKPVTR